MKKVVNLQLKKKEETYGYNYSKKTTHGITLHEGMEPGEGA
jgi:hypothetical protein